MTPDFRNVYDDRARARAYDALEFPGTYYLAYRDLPAIDEDYRIVFQLAELTLLETHRPLARSTEPSRG